MERLTPNDLVLHIQPDEGVTLSFGAKKPGPKVVIGGVEMRFDYKDYFEVAPSTGYETLIYDCMIGDTTLFKRAEEIEAGWRIVQPLLELVVRRTKRPAVKLCRRIGRTGRSKRAFGTRRTAMAAAGSPREDAMTRRRALPANIAAVVSDVDGTLVRSDKSVSPRTAEAARALQDAGVKFAIVSSRPPRGLRAIISRLNIAMPVAGFNGGVIASPDLSVITSHLIAADVARHAVEAIEASGANAWVFSGEDWFIRERDGPRVALEERTVGFGPTVVTDFAAVIGTAAKIVAVSDDFALLTKLQGEVREQLSGRANMVRSQTYYLDFTHPLANKGQALIELTRLMGVSRGQYSSHRRWRERRRHVCPGGPQHCHGQCGYRGQGSRRLRHQQQRRRWSSRCHRLVRHRRQADSDRQYPGAAGSGVMATASNLSDCIFENAEALARGAANWLCETAVAGSGRFAICCSGGTTPRLLYELLAQPPVVAAFPWSRVHWFWGDERFVPHDHPDSNYGMTRAAFLSKVKIPAGQYSSDTD